MTVGITAAEPEAIGPHDDIYCKIAATPPAAWIVPTPFVTTPNIDMAVGINVPDTVGAARPIIPDAAIDFVGTHIRRLWGISLASIFVDNVGFQEYEYTVFAGKKSAKKVHSKFLRGGTVAIPLLI